MAFLLSRSTCHTDGVYIDVQLMIMPNVTDENTGYYRHKCSDRLISEQVELPPAQRRPLLSARVLRADFHFRRFGSLAPS